MLKHQVRLFFFNSKVFYWKNISIIRYIKVLDIRKILISFNISNLKEIEDNIIVKFFYFLEVIGAQKNFIKNYKKKTLKVKNLSLTGQITLRGFKIYNFFDFFFFFIYPAFKKNFININISINSLGNITLNIKDLVFFPGLQEENQYIYPIKIDIIFNNSNLLITNFFLKEFDINLK
jgi:ribosomal protein L5